MTLNKPMLISAGAAVIGLILGGIIGHYITPMEKKITEAQQQVLDDYEAMMSDDPNKHMDYILNSINANNIQDNSRLLTIKPHLAGTDQDVNLANLFESRLREAGFDWVKKMGYNLLLSKPDPDNPNKVRLWYNNDVTHTTSWKETPIHENDDDDTFVHAFNAYTPPGDVRSNKLVYSNYGRVEDFEELKTLGVDVTDAIVICRYGQIFRGNKIDNAYKNGAKAVIIFSDPEDVASEGIQTSDIYDNSFWLPGTGMQRGTTYLGDGDPLTPGWPSTMNAHRINESDADLPKIPAQPIGYNDAMVFLREMQGPPPPSGWKGGLNVSYNLGPTLTDGYEVQITTNNRNEVVFSYNVFGVIKGKVEPDRYVIIGNHRDAWGYGGADPSSGTAQLLETARVLGELRKRGWRPKRTIIFCSWGAEEYGLIGSTEWVEENVNKLQERAVAYINTDTCSSGPILQANASPLLWDLIKMISDKVPGVQDQSSTVFKEWLENDKLRKPGAQEYPVMSTLGSGSDYAGFIFYAGVSSMDIWFRIDKAKYNVSIYPAYHTGYDTFYMMSQFIDPGFKTHQACGRVASLMLSHLADSKILPFNVARFPETMQKALMGFQDNGVKNKIMSIYNGYQELESSVNKLKEEADNFMDKIREGKRDFSPHEIRAINDQLKGFEQIFIIPEGLPGRPTTRHAIFAPSQFDNYASSGFPGINDLLYKYDGLSDSEKEEKNEQLRRHISHLTILTDRAISFLKNYEQFD